MISVVNNLRVSLHWEAKSDYVFSQMFVGSILSFETILTFYQFIADLKTEASTRGVL